MSQRPHGVEKVTTLVPNPWGMSKLRRCRAVVLDNLKHIYGVLNIRKCDE